MKKRFAEGGEATEMEPGAGGYEGEMPEPVRSEPQTFKEAFAEARAAGEKTFTWKGKQYSTEMAGAKPAAVSGRPRGESGPVSVIRQMADRAAADAMNARSASEARAAKARESESEMRREARGKDAQRKTPRISMAGVNAKTLLPEQRYAKGGSVKGWGCARGARAAKNY